MFEKLGIAPIAWTNDDLPDLGAENTFEQCISEMALAGFKGCELGNKFPRENVELLKHKLAIRGLSLCNAWFSTYFADGRRQETLRAFDEHLNFLAAMGAKVIGCSEQSLSIQGLDLPVFQAKAHFTDEQWRKVAEGYNEIASLAAAKGLKVCLHHHMGTGIQTPAEIDRFMDSVAGDVYLLFDTGHIYYSENSAAAMLAVLKKYLERIIHVHLKDVRPELIAEVKNKGLSFLDGVRLGTFTVPGDGAIDFAPIFELLAASGYDGWLVVEAEQDPAKANPFEYAMKARDYMRKFDGA